MVQFIISLCFTSLREVRVNGFFRRPPMGVDLPGIIVPKCFSSPPTLPLINTIFLAEIIHPSLSQRGVHVANEGIWGCGAAELSSTPQKRQTNAYSS